MARMHCNDCGFTFDDFDAATYTETERLSGRPTVTREFLCCPDCSSENIDYTTADEEE